MTNFATFCGFYVWKHRVTVKSKNNIFFVKTFDLFVIQTYKYTFREKEKLTLIF